MISCAIRLSEDHPRHPHKLAYPSTTTPLLLADARSCSFSTTPVHHRPSLGLQGRYTWSVRGRTTPQRRSSARNLPRSRCALPLHIAARKFGLSPTLSSRPPLCLSSPFRTPIIETLLLAPKSAISRVGLIYVWPNRKFRTEQPRSTARKTSSRKHGFVFVPRFYELYGLVEARCGCPSKYQHLCAHTV